MGLCVVALFAASCGDDGGGGGSAAGTSSQTTVSGVPATTVVSPTKGGTLSIGQFTPSRGLDPAVSSSYGCCGGNEDYALYDTIVRYDA